MSGYQTNLRYDVCATQQAIEQSTAPFRNYNFLLAKYENTLTSNTVATCDGKFAHIECNACKTNEGTTTNTLENLDYRISAENDLLGLTRPTTKCDSLKFQPCYIKDCDNKCNDNTDASSCDGQKVITQPLLCDRSINPTNMKPFTTAFSYN